MPTSDDQFPSQYPPIVFNLESGSKVTDDSCEHKLKESMLKLKKGIYLSQQIGN